MKKNSDVSACQYCAYWKGKKTGCVYEDGCCCDVPQKPARRNGIDVHYEEETPENQLPVSECVGCPYGRDSPCIGWCTKEAMRSVGLLKE